MKTFAEYMEVMNTTYATDSKYDGEHPLRDPSKHPAFVRGQPRPATFGMSVQKAAPANPTHDDVADQMGDMGGASVGPEDKEVRRHGPAQSISGQRWQDFLAKRQGASNG